MAVADTVDRAAPGVVLGKRLARRALHCPVDGLREEAHPVAGVLPRPGDPEERADLFAREEHEAVVRQPPALGEHRLESKKSELFAYTTSIVLNRLLFRRADLTTPSASR